jgi:hypothetical protein
MDKIDVPENGNWEVIVRHWLVDAKNPEISHDNNNNVSVVARDAVEAIQKALEQTPIAQHASALRIDCGKI